MPGMIVKAGIAGMVMIAGYMIISATPNNEAQAATCPALPIVSWWKTSHDMIVQHVDQQYNGKWDFYIAKWQSYHDKMKVILNKEGTAIIKSRGVRLKGKTLEKHIGDVEQRIRITQCLKEKHGGRLASLDSNSDQSFLGERANRVVAVLKAAKRQAIRLAKFSSYASTLVEKMDPG